MVSNRIKITVETRSKVNLRKLARAVIALAQRQAETPQPAGPVKQPGASS